MGTFMLRSEFRDVVALVVVSLPKLSCRLRLIAAEVALGSIGNVFQLLLQRQLKNSFRNGVLPSDFLVGESVSDNVEESSKALSWPALNLERCSPFLLINLRTCSASSLMPFGLSSLEMSRASRSAQST
ncbi:hypothetical protein MPH_06126 [Macrophomina phaseolina MS6]|uniref:Uncharacterized protein n=1 Tax=Macrophomina phaseolina (strain MS6) TaxID=1126212 RepID=K2RVE1_MACPH|nr:hypothetical protein MPH_06126 [Macrophomina phaseolina MS6]